MDVIVMNWVVNVLIFSLPFSWYMCWLMYKDMKKKDRIIKLQEEMLKEKGII
jgi:hypothetical protein